MTDEQWEAIIYRAEKQFGSVERGKEALTEVQGWIEWIEFDGHQGRMRLERTIRPRVVSEHTTFSKRIGSGVTVKKVYDPEEVVSFMRAYRWNEGNDVWEEIRGEWA